MDITKNDWYKNYQNQHNLKQNKWLKIPLFECNKKKRK